LKIDEGRLVAAAAAAEDMLCAHAPNQFRTVFILMPTSISKFDIVEHWHYQQEVSTKRH
jgi:hypothetical protein